MSLATEIAELESLLNTGVKATSTDGTSTTFDLPAARQRLATLKRQQDAAARPRAASIDLSGG